MKKLVSVAWLYIQNGKVLCVRSKGKEKFFIPGGKLEPDESHIKALSREIFEELTIRLKEETVSHLMTIEDVAFGLDNTMLEMHCYTAEFTGGITMSSEIEELCWVDRTNLHLCAPAAQSLIRNCNL